MHMKTILQIFHTLFEPMHNTNMAPEKSEAYVEYHQGEYFEHLAEQHHQGYLLHLSQDDISPQDQRNAMWNFLSAALRGHSDAQYKLGLAYFHGDLGLERNYSAAQEWLSRAAEAGHTQAQDHLNQMSQFIAFS